MNIKKAFFKEFPQHYKQRKVCVVDDKFAEHPNPCVIDDPEWDKGDCQESAKGKTKETCGYWRLEPKRAVIRSVEEVWEWVEKNCKLK